MDTIGFKDAKNGKHGKHGYAIFLNKKKGKPLFVKLKICTKIFLNKKKRSDGGHHFTW